MIDIHSHILPNVDDGPDSLKEAIGIARLAVREGIKTIIATPHHRQGTYQNEKYSIINEVKTFNKVLKKKEISLEVLPGQEVHIYEDIMRDYKKDKLLPINDNKYLLIELPYTHVPDNTYDLLYRLKLKGIVPIIVHPERNIGIRKNPRSIYRFVEMGILTQLTAGSLIGVFGKDVQVYAHRLIEHNLTHFIASDVHNTTTRGFHLREAYEMIEKRYGMDKRFYFQENAQCTLEGYHVYTLEPKVIKTKKFLGIFKK